MSLSSAVSPLVLKTNDSPVTPATSQGYVLSFGVLMVTFGRLVDIFGRRKIFFMGLVIFGLASLAGALLALFFVNGKVSKENTL